VKSRRRAIIIGGGVGGLSTALALSRIDWDVQLYERTQQIKPVGAAHTVWANAMVALKWLGVDREVVENGHPLDQFMFRRENGEVLSRFNVEEIDSALGASSVSITREALQKVLYNARGREKVILAKNFLGFEQGKDTVIAHFEDGSSDEGDVLIGADGLYSAVRSQLFNDGTPRYAGYNMWLGMTQFGGGLVPRELTFESWGKGGRFGAIHTTGGEMFWYFARTERRPLSDADEVCKFSLLSYVQRWHSPVWDIISSTPEHRIVRQGAFYRNPLKSWSKGHVTLVGDAARPIVASIGQGGGAAIEDAVSLADALQSVPNVWAALRSYQAARVERARYIMREARRLDTITQVNNPVTRWLRDNMMKALSSRSGLTGVRRQLQWTFS
jgi:2-polyprenyl-6-methoxyphenol hydroxylase-like FAD-dependent oxidoreductase